MNDLAYTTFEVESWENVPQALSSMVREIEDRVVPAQNKGRPWNYIRVELWPDSGRYIAFPAHFESDTRIDITGCQIICKEIEEVLSGLISSNLEDDEYEKEVEKILTKMAKLAKPHLKNLSCGSYLVVDSEGDVVTVE